MHLFNRRFYLVLCILLLASGCTSQNSTSPQTPNASPTPSETIPVESISPSPTAEASIEPLTLNLVASEPLPAPTFPEDSPAGTHGALKVDGIHILDANDEIYQLRGVSTHGIQWYGQFVNDESLQTLKDDWHINAIRLALYADAESLYLENQESYTAILEEGIQKASNLGLYVIVDWHINADGDPLLHQEEATCFFDYFSTKYQNYPNILFELCNEPNGGKVDWDEHIKPYADALIDVIRAHSPSSLVIVGTPKWCQSPLSVVRNRIEDPNVLYAFHFYANSHRLPLRETMENAIIKYELPLFISEFGTCESSGTGDINIEESNAWIDLLDQYNISWMNWSLCDKDESSALLLPGASTSNWSDDEITASGKYIKERLLSYTN